MRTPGVGAGLASMGIKPQDVTHILLTHVHFDHVIGLAVENVIFRSVETRTVRRWGMQS